MYHELHLSPQGTNPFFGNWSQTRKIMTPMPNQQTGKLSYFSTEDTYMRSPLEWWQGRATIRSKDDVYPPGTGPVGVSPDHSLQWLQSKWASIGRERAR
jgi:hypothetical protein